MLGNSPGIALEAWLSHALKSIRAVRQNVRAGDLAQVLVILVITTCYNWAARLIYFVS